MMANPEHLEILKQGVEVWNRWRIENSELRPDLSKADLTEKYLRRVNLSLSNLYGTNLSLSNLRDANLGEANLQNAILRGTILSFAKLNRADLGKADLYGVDLHRADISMVDLSAQNLSGLDLRATNIIRTNFSGANLSEVNLEDARAGSTIFGNVDLRQVNRLCDVRHFDRSYIDVHTLWRSKGQISEPFLRGCGLSDVQIEMTKFHNPDLTSEQITTITYKIYKLLIGGAIHYHSCFISYSSNDEDFARKLYDNLQNNGVRCWFAPEDMKIGDKIRPTIDQSIRIHDKLLIILSENSLDSEWVESEVEKAFEEERSRKQTVLFPVRLDEAVMETEESWAAEIRRTRHIGDFSRWKEHDTYQAAFERLLRDLKAEG